MEQSQSDTNNQTFQRAEELADNLSEQQLFGYVAALLEVVAQNQANTHHAIIKALEVISKNQVDTTQAIIERMESNTFDVRGTVWIHER